MTRSQKQFSERLTLLRQAQGMTQQTVADILNVSRPAYTYYELGQSSPSLESIRRLIRLFCPTEPRYLLGLETAPSIAKLQNDAKECCMPLMAHLTAEEQRVVGMFRVMEEEQRACVLLEMTKLLNEEV